MPLSFQPSSRHGLALYAVGSDGHRGVGAETCDQADSDSSVLIKRTSSNIHGAKECASKVDQGTASGSELPGCPGSRATRERESRDPLHRENCGWIARWSKLSSSRNIGLRGSDNTPSRCSSIA